MLFTVLHSHHGQGSVIQIDSNSQCDSCRYEKSAWVQKSRPTLKSLNNDSATTFVKHSLKIISSTVWSNSDNLAKKCLVIILLSFPLKSYCVDHPFGLGMFWVFCYVVTLQPVISWKVTKVNRIQVNFMPFNMLLISLFHCCLLLIQICLIYVQLCLLFLHVS